VREVEGHHDFTVLEARLAELVREAKAEAGPFAPVLVVVPTSRLGAHVRTALAGRLGGVLGVEVLHHHALAAEAARAAGLGLPREIGRRAREAILGDVLSGMGGPLAAYAAARPGALAALAATMDDLRDAGVDPDAAASVAGVSERGREAVRLYGEYYARMAALSGRGLADRAGIRRAALPHVGGFARRFRLAVHHGAYELTGANLALMEAVEAAAARVVYLVPHHPSSRAFAYARRFAERLGGARPIGGTAGPPETLLGPRLPILYDEAAPVPPAIEGKGITFVHAQGAAGELREAALGILALHRDEKIPLHQIAVVARTLAPYAHLLRPVLHDTFRIPFVTSARLPALRDPHVQAARQLARAALGDFERQPLMDFLRGGLARIGGRGTSERAHAWERLGREFHAARGRTTWTALLPRWVEAWRPHLPADATEEARAGLEGLKERRRREAADLAGAVAALWGAARPLIEAGSWSAWAAAMEGLLREAIAGFAEDEPGPGCSAVLDALGETAVLDAAGAAFERGAALAFFERAVEEAAVPIPPAGGEAGARGRDNGGVRVLDAMQARGLVFDAVFVVGLNSGLFPQHPREDPFLPDADRRLLRAALRALVPVKSARIEEEHLLLAHMLGSARRRVVVSWQRADEAGRARVASLALREAARAALGAADPRRAEEAARRAPAHPAEALAAAARGAGLIPPREARLGAALQSLSPRALLEALPRAAGLFGAAGGDLRRGLAMLDVIEAFSPADLGHDAFVGEAAPPPQTWSPSRLETLGNCPQQYFFRHVLRVEEMEEAEEGYVLDAKDLGLRVHAVLKDVYQDLLDRGLLSRPGADPSEAVRRALAVLEDAWAAHTLDLAERTAPRYLILWEATRALWLNAITTFVLHDVAALVREEGRILGLEHDAGGEIRLGGGAAFSLRGRFDRVRRTREGGILVGDYKTGGRIEDHVKPAEILKGRRLQMPLYALLARERAASWGLAGAGADAEILGVGPSFAPAAAGAGGEEPYPARVLLDPEEFARSRAGIEETLRVLVDLAAAGAFPLNASSPRCGFCPYVRACRRRHAPTLTRIGAAPAASEFLLLTGKSTRARTLAEVRARGGPEEPS
jgi:RecB family exonuclease